MCFKYDQSNRFEATIVGEFLKSEVNAKGGLVVAISNALIVVRPVGEIKKQRPAASIQTGIDINVVTPSDYVVLIDDPERIGLQLNGQSTVTKRCVAKIGR